MIRAIRQLRRSIGLEPLGFADFLAPALGVLAVGLVAGAGIALLVAPMTGQKLRAEMERKLGELRSRLLLSQGDEGGRRNNASQRAEPSPLA